MDKPQIYQKDAYPSNSKTKKLEERETRVNKVVTGKVKQQKRGFFKRITDSLMANDGRSIGEYVVWDILIPAAKELIYDLGKGTLEMSLFGEKRGSRTRREGGTSYVSYEKMHVREREQRSISKVGRVRHDFDEIVMETRGEAEAVLSTLVDLVVDYGQATVADLYDSVGLDAAYTDDAYGWTDLKDASVHRARGGYVLNLPRPISLK